MGRLDREVTEVTHSEISDKKTATSGFIIERTAKRMKQALHKRLLEQEAGITADQWVLLNILADDGPASQFEIAERSYKDAPTVTRMIDLLLKKGLVDRLADPGDRRRFQIVLTAEGQRKYQETLPLVREIRALGYDGLTEADLNQLIRIMNTIFQNFDNAKRKDHALL
jgi:DNA-binding MarR family transcriptional regulator